MAMREPVAMDFMGVRPPAAAGSSGSGRSADVVAAESGRLVRPIPSGGHARRSPEAAGGPSHAFASSGNNLHGLRKQPWSRRGQSEDEHAVSSTRERASPDTQGRQFSDNSAPASPSHHNPGEFWRMPQLARKVQTMFAGHQQAASQQQAGSQRTPPFRDEAAQRGAQPDVEHQPQPPASQAAFGSPTPFHFQANGASAAAMASKRSPFQNHPFQAGAASRYDSGGGKQQTPSTAQLTIFYDGMVNVYNEVPFDKAQAIMLLAGSGNSWSSNYKNNPVPARNPYLKAPMAVPQSRPSTPGSPAAPAHPPSSVELPQARKASLARFLEKRKDRVRKAPVIDDYEPAGPSRDNSPGAAPAKLRSSSPSGASQAGSQEQQQQQRGSGASSRRDPGNSSEPNSPPTRPPGTPPRQSMPETSEKKSPAAPKRRDNAAAEETSLQSPKRARTGKSPRRLPDPDEPSSL